ncbi:hypothetical protein Dimus_018228 [Dionaea muscipula]
MVDDVLAESSASTPESEGVHADVPEGALPTIQEEEEDLGTETLSETTIEELEMMEEEVLIEKDLSMMPHVRRVLAEKRK